MCKENTYISARMCKANIISVNKIVWQSKISVQICKGKNT